jgi:TPR repeat protein
MPEVPSNMQDNLAHLELESRSMGDDRMSSQSTVSSVQSPQYQQSSLSHSRESSRSSLQRPKGPGFTASYEHTNAAAYQNLNRNSLQHFGVAPDSPAFSPFPKLRDAGDNVPLSDDEKEEVLDRARPIVLKSTDPEMQLAWAQDALSWVEVANASHLRQQAESGQPARSMTPKIEHQLRVDAISIVNFLADQHHPKAEFMKGMWLEFGKFGFRVDKREAFLAYKRAAERNYARAEYRIGMQYESSENAMKAIEHYRKGVVMKDSASHYRLGMMTLLGQHDTPQDFAHGIDLIRYAADTADENAPQGAYVYGLLLGRELPNITIPDEYLPYDINEAKHFIEKAAYLGFAKAQLKMAQAYELCQLGCEFEPALSLHYNALASRQGEAEADMAISKWFLCGYEGIFEKNEELAFTYAKRAASAKMPTAEFALGYFYEIGVYVPIDLHESEVWYQKAADHGNKDALGRIDSIKKNDPLSKKDHEQVAISRIKSQYGSQRGGRPDRFKQRAAPMPSMQEDNRPEASFGGSDTRGHQTNNLTPRPISVAPYPEDDMPPRLQPSRSPNSQGLRPNSSMGIQADRPSSAFGIRPMQHAATESFGQPHSAVEATRPSSSMGNMTIPNGRGGNPAGSNRIMSAGWEPQLQSQQQSNYRGPSNQLPRSPQVDHNRSYSADPGANRLQKQPPGNMSMNKPHPQPPSFPQTYAADAQPPRITNPAIRPDSASMQRNNLYPNNRGNSMTPVTPSPVMSPPYGGRSGYDSSSLNSSMSSNGGGPSRASNRSQATLSSTMSSQGGSSMGPPPPQKAAPPKKQGPATFEEMGIPAGKNESECVSLSTTLTYWHISG